MTILDSHSCWGHDQLGRMGKKSLQLEDDNKTSHCSQLRYMGNFFRAVSLVMRCHGSLPGFIDSNRFLLF